MSDRLTEEQGNLSLKLHEAEERVALASAVAKEALSALERTHGYRGSWIDGMYARLAKIDGEAHDHLPSIQGAGKWWVVDTGLLCSVCLANVGAENG